MEVLLQQILSGLATGSLYALAAFGLVLIFKTMDVVNFANGEMAMVSAFVAHTCISNFGLSYAVSFLVAVIFGGLLGMVVERLVIHPIEDTSPLNLIVVTLGLFMIFNGAAGLIWGYSPTSFPEAIEGAPVNIAGAEISPHNLLTIIVCLAIMGSIYLFFKKTMAGIAIRATAEDITTARLMGIKVSEVFLIIWAVSTILGATAGILIAPTTFLSVNMMTEVQIKAFSGAVLGGFTSLPGAVVGSLLLGISENLVAGYISTKLKTTFAFGLIILVLWLKPSGLLGESTK